MTYQQLNNVRHTLVTHMLKLLDLTNHLGTVSGQLYVIILRNLRICFVFKLLLRLIFKKKKKGLDSGYLSSDTCPATDFLCHFIQVTYPHQASVFASHTKEAELSHHSKTQVALYKPTRHQGNKNEYHSLTSCSSLCNVNEIDHRQTHTQLSFQTQESCLWRQLFLELLES